MSAPELSVVIPTRDRRDALAVTLDALDAQEGIEPGAVEVVVVDNGSTDDTLALLAARTAPAGLRVLREPRPGPAAARNTGIREARGAVVLLLGDDMIPAGPGLVAGHLDLHRRDPDAHYAVLGRATWKPGTETPFMRWTETDLQFAFDRLEPGQVPVAKYFYTSQISLKREALAEFPFDERFPFAALEDTELGDRLERWGLRLDYHPELLVHHDHPTDVWAFGRRMEKIGASARLLHAIHPRGAELMPGPEPRWRLAPLAEPLLRAALRHGRADGPRWWSAFLWCRYADGWRRAERILPPGTLPA